MKRLASGLAVLALAACTTPAPATASTLTIFAANSLKDVFPRIGAEFVKIRPGVTFRWSFLGSSDLATQINEGADVDVFASADEKQMSVVTETRRATRSRVFATNTLTVITPPNNPAGIGSLSDLNRPDIKEAICQETVPCGAATRKLAESTGLTLTPASEESKVGDVLTKVAAGEADAGLVYVTDAMAAADTVHSVPTPEAAAIVNRYPIAVTDASHDPELAQAFADFVLSETGQSLLREAGFGAAS